jgi:hypothetical protein
VGSEWPENACSENALSAVGLSIVHKQTEETDLSFRMSDAFSQKRLWNGQSVWMLMPVLFRYSFLGEPIV